MTHISPHSHYCNHPRSIYIFCTVSVGDLYIEIDVANDPYFKREKNDIYTEVHVGMAQAALGCTVDVVRN